MVVIFTCSFRWPSAMNVTLLILFIAPVSARFQLTASSNIGAYNERIERFHIRSLRRARRRRNEFPLLTK